MVERMSKSLVDDHILVSWERFNGEEQTKRRHGFTHPPD